jgi:fatty-acyl-CoA synthase
MTLATIIEASLARWPDRTCVIDGVSGQGWSYAAIASAAAAWGRRFRELGLTRGAGVAILSTNRPDLVAAILGVIAAGLRYTPLHPLASSEDLAFILKDGDIACLVLDGAATENAAALRQRARCAVVDLDEVPLVETGRLETLRAAPGIREQDIAMLTYTGGTTGRPKGVIQPHRVGLSCFLLQLAEWSWPRVPRFLIATPLSHAPRWMALPVLWRGGTVVLLPGARGLGAAVREHAIDSLFLVPSVLYRLLDGEHGPDSDFGSLRMLLYGGSAVAPKRIAEAVGRFGPVFTQLYGQAEAPLMVSTLQPEDHDLARPHLLASCGRPSPSLDVAILDDAGVPVAIDAPGELCVRGALVMDGYWMRPEETADALKGGWLHTGDIAHADDEGFLYIVDRKKDMVVTGGFNVFTREVEDVLLSHPAVAAAVVIGIPDPIWGESVMAAVTLRPGKTVTASDLQALVRQRKGPVHAPKLIELMDALPLTATGKPDKKLIRSRFWAGHDRGVS